MVVQGHGQTSLRFLYLAFHRQMVKYLARATLQSMEFFRDTTLRAHCRPMSESTVEVDCCSSPHATY